MAEAAGRADQPFGGEILARAETDPDGQAIIHHRADGRMEDWSWRRLAAAAHDCISLHRATDATWDGCIGWIGWNDPHQIAQLLACAWLGMAQVPLNWRLSTDELRWICSHAGFSWLDQSQGSGFAHPFAERFGGGWSGTVPDEPEKPPEKEPPDVIRDYAALPLVIGYTSGTTGRPKGVVLTQGNFAANAAAAQALFEMTPADRILTVLPMFHVGGLNIQTVPALVHGATVILHERFDPDAFFDSVERDRPTLTLLVPAVMAALVTHPRWDSADLSSLRAIGAGSSEVPLRLIEAFHAKGIPVQQVYGATETCPIAIAQTREEALAAPGSIGRPAPGTEARIDPASGEILVRGPQVMTGYWRDGAATAAALRDGWFRTGDVGRIDPEGRFWFTDRLKHLIISGGENISPAEVERVLLTAPGVREGAVVGRPDPRWGEVPVAVVVPAEGFDAAAVLRHFEGRLARFKHPRAVVVVEGLPRTALGKLAVAEVRTLAGRS